MTIDEALATLRAQQKDVLRRHGLGCHGCQIAKAAMDIVEKIALNEFEWRSLTPGAPWDELGIEMDDAQAAIRHTSSNLDEKPPTFANFMREAREWWKSADGPSMEANRAKVFEALRRAREGMLPWAMWEHESKRWRSRAEHAERELAEIRAGRSVTTYEAMAVLSSDTRRACMRNARLNERAESALAELWAVLKETS